MSSTIITDLKIQEEVKMKVNFISRTDPQFKALDKIVNELFQKIDLTEDREWDIKFSLKFDTEGSRHLTGVIKMTDKSVTGEQLSIFTDSKEYVSQMSEVK